MTHFQPCRLAHPRNPSTMLQLLRIENLALLDAVSLEFSGGFTAVTGETGAGKSVLLGALSLLAGNRTDKSVIRKGAEQCCIEAAITVPPDSWIHHHIAEQGLPACEEGQLLLRRVIPRQKAARVFINGALATLTQLQEIGHGWIDFHGPGEPQKLFKESEQLALLDVYAGLREERTAFRRDFNAWKAALREIDQLRNEARLSPEEAEFLRNRVAQIDQLKLSPERIHQLEIEWRQLSNFQERKEESAALYQTLDGPDGLIERLQTALPAARRLAELDPEAASLADRLESLLLEARDISGECAAIAGQDSLDDDSLQQVESDMETWMTLQRQYGNSVEQVLQRREEMARRLQRQGNVEETIQTLTRQAGLREKALREQATALRARRGKAAARLTRKAEKLLRHLGFKNPRIAMELHATPQLGPTGDTDCQLTFQPNPGQDPLPLQRIASSGEMARVMLALKSVLAGADATPVLVFDEVDANIGGEVATSVADLLADLGNAHQVFCITHLPMVAAKARHHFRVSKDQDAASTAVRIEPLAEDRDALLDELARMLGDRSSQTARQHAADLLQRADKPT